MAWTSSLITNHRESRGRASDQAVTRLCPAAPYIPGMLRMRKKPSSGLETINSGQPWSAMDLSDLDGLVTDRVPVADIADFVCRDVEEVEAKIAERRRH
jgi:hypothetical protein